MILMSYFVMKKTLILLIGFFSVGLGHAYQLDECLKGQGKKISQKSLREKASIKTLLENCKVPPQASPSEVGKILARFLLLNSPRSIQDLGIILDCEKPAYADVEEIYKDHTIAACGPEVDALQGRILKKIPAAKLRSRSNSGSGGGSASRL